MSKRDKILRKLLSLPKDFTWQELSLILHGFGYKELQLGKTSGSRVAFYNAESDHIIRLHKPHPGNILKRYQLELIIKELKKTGDVNEG